jgi:hypothetical protein
LEYIGFAPLGIGCPNPEGSIVFVELRVADIDAPVVPERFATEVRALNPEGLWL